MSATSPPDLHLSLLRAYAAILQRTRGFPPVLWLCVFRWRRVRFLPVPIPRVAISVLLHRHIRRALDALEDIYQLRRAASEKGELRDQWTDMRDQVVAMKAALPHRAIPAALLALVGSLLVLLAGQILPKDDFALFAQTIGAIVTLKLDKFVEIAAKPEAFWAIFRGIIWLFVVFVLLVPIIVCWFRCKRFLFNHLPLPSAHALTTQTVVSIWKEEKTLRHSVYAVENRLFEALGESPLHEIPIDYYASMVVYVYFLASGAVLTGLAVEPLIRSRSASWDLRTLLPPAAALFGGINRLAEYRTKIRNRRKLT